MAPLGKPPPFSGRTLVVAVVVIVVGVVLMWAASAALTARHNRQMRSEAVGGQVDLGDAARLAATFERGGSEPLYFPDLSGDAQRAVYLTHDGGPSDQGWTAFRAQVPGEKPDCQWEWNDATDRFDASCDPDRHADAEGTGLERYPVRVRDGSLTVDLRRSPSASTTTGP